MYPCIRPKCMKMVFGSVGNAQPSGQRQARKPVRVESSAARQVGEKPQGSFSVSNGLGKGKETD